MYDYRAVTKIMVALLSEKDSKAKLSTPGRPGRRWLSDPALRTVVLRGIEARVKAIDAPTHIADAFTRTVQQHITNSD